MENFWNSGNSGVCEFMEKNPPFQPPIQILHKKKYFIKIAVNCFVTLEVTSTKISLRNVYQLIMTLPCSRVLIAKLWPLNRLATGIKAGGKFHVGQVKPFLRILIKIKERIYYFDCKLQSILNKFQGDFPRIKICLMMVRGAVTWNYANESVQRALSELMGVFFEGNLIKFIAFVMYTVNKETFIFY